MGCQGVLQNLGLHRGVVLTTVWTCRKKKKKKEEK
jgi:hypothetical protein